MSHKWEAGPFKNPLARARGLGNGHGALHHWMNQRITSLALIPLTLWAIWSVVALSGATYANFQDWIVAFPNPILLGLFVLTSFYHAALGLQVVIEDYMHCECVKLGTLIGMRLAIFALAATAIFSILKLAL